MSTKQQQQNDHADVLKKYPFAESVVASAETTRKEVDRLAREIKASYTDLTDDNPLVVVGVLKGSFIFMSDLCRSLSQYHVPHVAEFLCLSSYGAASKSSGEVRMLLDLRHSIYKKHCLVVEDVVDSGRTLQFLDKILSCRSPATLKFCVMLDKPDCHAVPTPHIDFLMMTAPNGFLVGIGLDWNEKYRTLPDILVLKPEVYAKPKPVDQEKAVVVDKESGARRERE